VLGADTQQQQLQQSQPQRALQQAQLQLAGLLLQQTSSMSWFHAAAKHKHNASLGQCYN
jgi:hypothetical protein